MKTWNKNFTLLASAVFGMGMFFGIQFALFYNFINDVIHINPDELGYMEGLRETPGFLNALFIAATMYLAPPIIGGISLVVMGLGMVAYSQVSTVPGVVVFSLIWSIGFHCWTPLQSAMTLAYSPGDEKGKPLGQLRSVESFATMGAILLCLFFINKLEFGGMFIIGGLAVVIGGILVMFASRNLIGTLRESRFVLKKRYNLYYLLSFLQGCRKQMFMTFAIFLLVNAFDTNRDTIIKLVLINQFMIFATSSLMGKLVDRWGERIMLSASYIGLFFVSIGYALIREVNTLYVLYCIDNLIFVGGIALTTYLNKIAPPEDIKPTLAMGVSMNHIASVIVPLIGGAVWKALGYDVVFLGGAAIAAASIIVTQWMKPERVVSEKIQPEIAGK
ncbi:MFS transporter [Candidatus Poribacteria bacterium]|nr:MFS transporter [Candidatus Poribacteria bacterium]